MVPLTDECIIDYFIIIDLPHTKQYLNDFIQKIKELFSEMEEERIKKIILPYFLEE